MGNIYVYIGILLFILSVLSFVGYFLYRRYYNKHINNRLHHKSNKKIRLYPDNYLKFICLPIFMLYILFWAIVGIYTIYETKYSPTSKYELEYELKEDNTYKVIGIGNLNSKDLVIPSSYKGRKVTSIGEFAFSYVKISSVYIPDSVTEIEYSVFMGCSELTSVRLSNNLTKIDFGVFNACTSLEQINIPSGVVSIGEFAFADCSSLAIVNMGDDITVIEDSAFSGCKKLVSFDFPLKLNRLGNYVFSYSGLINLVLPDTLTKLGTGVFKYCTELIDVKLGDGIKGIPEETFINCTKLKSVEFGKNITYVGDKAFYLCSNLADVLLNDSLKVIGEYAFYGCDDLETIDLIHVEKISSYAFSRCYVLSNINLGSNIKYLYKYAFEGCEVGSIYIPKSVIYIDFDCFISTKLNLIYYEGTVDEWELIEKENNKKEINIVFNYIDGV